MKNPAAGMSATGRRPFLASLLGGACLPLAGQQAQSVATEIYKPKQSDRPEALAGDEAGFRPLFNGKNLEGWEGDPKYWRFENGNLVGEITPETVVKSNTFIIWRGGSPKDFELKVDYRMTAAGNSGINYRSVVVPDAVTPLNKFAMRGYQADIDGKNVYTGQNYEEKGRLFLGTRGQVTHVVGGRKPIVLASLGDDERIGLLHHHRLEFLSPDHSRECADPHSEWPHHVRRYRRRSGGTHDGRADRSAGTRGTANEGGVSEFSAEGSLSHSRSQILFAC